MLIKIKMKQIGKLHEFLTYQNYETKADTVQDLIREAVAVNVAEYNRKRDKSTLLLCTDSVLDASAENGKIAFGAVQNKRKVDVRVMQDEALFQFKNARFKIVNETTKHEYTLLEEPLNLKEGDALVFIKLALLTGRMF